MTRTADAKAAEAAAGRAAAGEGRRKGPGAAADTVPDEGLDGAYGEGFDGIAAAMGAFEDSLDDDSLGRITAKELRGMMREFFDLRQIPEWAVVQMLFVPPLRRALADYTDPEDEPGPRVCSYVRVVLKEIVRTKPPLPDDDGYGDGAPGKDYHNHADDDPMAMTEALTRLAQYYSMGVFCKPDTPKTLDYCRQAAERGGFDATVFLAHYYRDGADGTEEDYRKAFEYYSLAYLSEPLMPDARFGLALMYFDGLGTPRDEALAVHVFQDLAEALERSDNPWMQSDRNKALLYGALFHAYRDGRGVGRSPLGALEQAYKLESVYRDALRAADDPGDVFPLRLAMRDLRADIDALHAELDSDPTAASL